MWCRRNKLITNIDKTFFVIFRSKHANAHNDIQYIESNNMKIYRRDHAKYLGVILDECLK
jgi:hypothetical protein